MWRWRMQGVERWASSAGRVWADHPALLLSLLPTFLPLHSYPSTPSRAAAVGLASFLLIVHACATITRQCGACLTALDPVRGVVLHEYHTAARRRFGSLLLPPEPSTRPAA